MEIAIIGLGLIGGSLGLALKEKELAEQIIGIPRRQQTIDQALAKGVIDEGTLNVVEGVKNADLVFICTPINLILPKLKEILPYLKKGAVVTDVGSTKAEIVTAAQQMLPRNIYFVGGHPMAGKETTGIAVAEKGLFAGCAYFLTPTSRTSKKALKLLKKLISALGGKVIIMDPKTHDEVVAAVSHLPIAVAAALVNTVAGRTKIKGAVKIAAASGFRDTTRVASGDPVLGRDIFLSNRKQVLGFIAEFKRSLGEIESLMRAGKEKKILSWLKKAKQTRDKIFYG